MTFSTIEIVSLANGGDGVARQDKLVVFTPRTAPGDLVEVDVRVEGRVGRGTLRRVLRAGPGRVEPACAHYAPPDRCGGCQWQHVSLDTQRAAKQQMVADAFARIAKRPVPLPEIHGGDGWRYRRSLTLAIRRVGARTWAGLRAHDDPEAVFALVDCQITDTRVVDAWRAILTAAHHLPPGDRLRGTVRWLDARPLLVLEGGTEWPALGAFLDAVPSLAAVWWQAEASTYRDVAILADDQRDRLPELALPEDYLGRPVSGAPVFVGHYWMTGAPKLQSAKVACVDWSAAKNGPLVAYRWAGEEELDASRFVEAG